MISITRVEYCRFSLKGKLRLLDLFGEVVFEKITQKEEMVVFKLNDFYVAVIKDMEINSVIDAVLYGLKSNCNFIFLNAEKEFSTNN